MINFNSTNTESLKKKSEKILGIFTKTKEDLITLIQETREYKASIEQKRYELEKEEIAATSAIAENESIVKKIEDFLK